MTNVSSTISPRRRNRISEVPAPAISPAAPSGEIDTPPRVLIRLPAIKAVAPTPTTKPAATISAGPSATPVVAAPAWRARVNSAKFKRYLPHAIAAVVVALGVFLVIRGHSGKSPPVAADSEAPVWNNGAALPNRQVGGMTPSGSANVPNWNAPAFPASNGFPPGTSPSAPSGSPSAYQTPPGFPGSSPLAPPIDPAPPSSYQTNSAPTNGWQSPGAAPIGAASGPPGAQNDSIPPMPARGPAWGNPASDPAVVQGGPIGPEYRTARTNDPAAIPLGRSPNDSSDAGFARFQGTIARPQ